MAAHRYWRIYITANDGGSTCAIAKLAGAESLGGADVFTGGTASASSEAAIFQGGSGVAAWAFDNDASTSWNSGSATFPQWLAYDLGGAVTKDIHQVSITFTNSFWVRDTANAPAAFDVQFSDDGTSWTTYWSVDSTQYVMGFYEGQTKSFSDLPGNARLTQEVIEPVRTDTAPAAVLTQLAIETQRTVTDGTLRTDVTQLAIETQRTVVGLRTDVSQVVIETERTNTALGARVTQIVIETIRKDLEDIPEPPVVPKYCVYRDFVTGRIGKLTLNSSSTELYTDLLTDRMYMAMDNRIYPVFDKNKRTGKWKSKKIVMREHPNIGWVRVNGPMEGVATIRIYGDTVLWHTSTLTLREPQRLPAGRHKHWEVEIESDYQFTSVVMASTTAELFDYR